MERGIWNRMRWPKRMQLCTVLTTLVTPGSVTFCLCARIGVRFCSVIRIVNSNSCSSTLQAPTSRSRTYWRSNKTILSLQILQAASATTSQLVRCAIHSSYLRTTYQSLSTKMKSNGISISKSKIVRHTSRSRAWNKSVTSLSTPHRSGKFWRWGFKRRNLTTSVGFHSWPFLSIAKKWQP